MQNRLIGTIIAAMYFVMLTGSGEANAAPDCRDEVTALSYWQPVRQRADAGDLPVNDLALELVSCLSSPNPELRDRIGYELLTQWLRDESLSDQTRTMLLIRLSSNLVDSSEGAAFSRSFSALILAELMRSDGISPFMSDRERQTLLDRANVALQNERDFRGLEEGAGWVHPIAHLADLHWRFALHPASSSAQTRAILSAVRTKVAPTEIAYQFNEGDRLARIVTTIITRNLLGAETIGAWLATFQAPQSMGRWSEAFQSPAGMTELHNTKQFLRALSDQLAGAEVSSEISEPLAELVQGFTDLI